ncbi:MAG: pyruvate ferredoxin oxidoreductase [Chloroflexi bacterium]|nr:pyruvate ferredoxin oxidoreductase [Chloroflexota bacterium]
MVKAIRELTQEAEGLASGHGLCAGCAESVVARQVLHAVGEPVVVACATGCLEIATTRYPNTAWKVPWIHSAFENAASTISGVEAAYRALVRKGRMAEQDIKFIAFGGDGATYDIGLQWLSGALERGHRFIYICLNNEGYMNTGIQRSGATILGTWTTTTPVGKALPGKTEWRKDLTAIIAAHHIPYVAQAAPHAWKDLIAKVEKAAAVDGPSFINVLSPCTRGWRYEPSDTMQVSKLAVETCVWPLVEIEKDAWKLSYKPSTKKPVTEWLKAQGRFTHLLRPENKGVLETIQQRVDEEWTRTLRLCGVA